MGASESAPSIREYTHEAIYDNPSTTNTRKLMNDILEYMLNRLTIHDLTAMSDPNHCKNYIAFKADHLYRFFHHLQITPVRDERDRIFFKSIRSLSEPPIRAEQNQLCFTIAYFYTRIFQIYGALALTLHDDINYMRDSGILSSTIAPAGQFGSHFHAVGGAVTDTLGNFDFIRPFLSEKTEQGYISNYQDLGLIFFKRENASTDNLIQFGYFSIEIRGFSRIRNIKFNVAARRITGELSTITLLYRNVSYQIRGEERERQFDIPSGLLPTDTQITFRKDSTTGEFKSSGTSQDRKKLVAEYLTEVFRILIPFIQTKITTDERERIERGTTGTAGTTTGSTGSTGSTGTAGTALVGPVGKGSAAALQLLSQVKIHDRMQIRTIISNLVEQRPLAHCVARAMQLLKMVPSGGVSHICKARFMSSADGKTKMGTPEKGRSLDTNIGLSSMSQLFYDTIGSATPSLDIGTTRVSGNRSSYEQYVAFMRRMSTFFEGVSTTKTNEKLVMDGLKGIINRRDEQLCRGLPEELSFATQSTIPGIISRYVAVLYQYQFDHSVECGKIINELFEIRADSVSGQNSIRIHPRLFDVGMTELDRINDRARNVLVRYYSFCEFIYTFTMQLILKLRNGLRAPTTTAPITSTPITSTPTTSAPTTSATASTMTTRKAVNPSEPLPLEVYPPRAPITAPSVFRPSAVPSAIPSAVPSAVPRVSYNPVVQRKDASDKNSAKAPILTLNRRQTD